MDQRQKELLDSARSELADSIDFLELARLLKLGKLVSNERVEEIVVQAETSFTRNLKLLDALQESKSTDAFEDFIRILEITNNNDALRLLSPNRIKKQQAPEGTRGMNSGDTTPINSSPASNSSKISPRPQELCLARSSSMTNNREIQSENDEPIVCWHPYEQAQGSRASSPHYCNPSYVSISSADSDSSSDSVMIDPNLILDSKVTEAIARESTHQMSVKLTSVCHNNSEEDYKMTARPRGPCLIVNNIDFEGEMFPPRKGSDEDARRFDDIFQQLGFTVIMRRNQTADQMRQLFKNVAAECKPEHDALFVFILSHGSEHGIYGTDGLEVYLESEIISCFDNRNCKAMLGKPKVFVIQACRGRAKDCGGDGDAIDSIAWSVMTTDDKAASHENRVPASWLPSSQPRDGKKRKHPIRTDMLLVFSCLAGFVSVRNELAGSWLGVALAYFIMTHAHERDLLRILNLVTSDVIQRESSHGHIQSIELKLLGWTKNLYFNPGIYI